MVTRVFARRKTLAEGYLAAYARLHEAMRDGREPEATFIPLFETLNWFVALDDRLREDGWEAPTRARELFDAVRFARGRVHHQWADALELRDDVMPPHVFLGMASPTQPVYLREQGPFLDWCWLPLAALPEPEQRHRKGEKEYDEELAGKPARYALGQLRNFIVTLTFGDS